MIPETEDHRWVESSGWRFQFPGEGRNLIAAERERLVAASLDAVSGKRAPHRRSRYASTYRLRLEDEICNSQIDTIFLKVLDCPSGVVKPFKRVLRGASSAHLVNISARLRSGGIEAPPVLLTGYELSSGREMVAIEGLPGHTLAHFLSRKSWTDYSTKRAILHALGSEVARFHRLGYVHGDLTPYNVLVTSPLPPRFGFIDHERTRRRRLLAVTRHRMRNLVQLGRFDFPGLSRTDRMRVFVAYADAMRINRERALRRVSRMLQARLRRDGARGLFADERSSRAIKENGAWEEADGRGRGKNLCRHTSLQRGKDHRCGH